MFILKNYYCSTNSFRKYYVRYLHLIFIFSKLTFDIDVINDKRIVLLKQINSLNEKKFQSSILFKIIQSIICKFSKIDTWQRMNRYKNYFQFTQKFKIKKSPNQRILFSRGWTSRTDNILISWIRSFHRSWIQINTLFGIIQCKTTVTRIFLFSFFFLLARDRPPTHVLIKALCSEPNYHPTSNSNLLFTWTPIIPALNRLRKLITPIRSRTILTYPIDSDFLARGFEIVFRWKRVENIWS